MFGVYWNPPFVFNVRAPFVASVIRFVVSVSPSMSVSFVSTPGAGMFSVVSSSVVYSSLFAVGGSFIGFIVIVTVAVFEFSVPSYAWYVNVSIRL